MVFVTACAECYTTFKVEYPKLFEDFSEKFEVKHIIEYIYEMWKESKIEFVGKNESEEAISFTYQDPCRLSRFLPDDNDITEIVREIFKEFKKLDILITNFHMPESTLMMLVSAFAGYENIMNAYKIAVEEKYRFFSYGDSMLIL